MAVGADEHVHEGSVFTVTGSFTDPDLGDAWTSTVDYGDGSGPQPLVLSGQTFELAHAYADDGTYAVTVRVTDRAGEFGTGSLHVAVDNVAPTVDAGADQSADEGAPVSLAASFTDPGAGDTHSATIDWGDGILEAGVVGVSGAVNGTHVYADNGLYTVRVAVTDDDGGLGSDTLAVTVRNIAPSVNAGADQTTTEGTAAWRSLRTSRK